MASAAKSRRPGIRFKVETPPSRDALPRMDIAVFAGFAAAGPLHTPVPIEDYEQFTEIFGEELALAWDCEKNELVHAHLAPTVRTFLSNGGRRCWVIRVASDEAQSNWFPLTGLLAAKFDDNGRLESLRPAFARARSEGSWSDVLDLSTALQSQEIDMLESAAGLDPRNLELAVKSSPGAEPGDLLRLQFGEDYLALLVVASVQHAGIGGSTDSECKVIPGPTLWFSRQMPQNLAVSGSQDGIDAKATYFSSSRDDGQEDSEFACKLLTHMNRALRRELQALQLGAAAENPFYSITLHVPLGAHSLMVPPIGTTLLIEVQSPLDLETERLWMTLLATDFHIDEKKQSQVLQLTGPGLWQCKSPPESVSGANLAVDKLTFEIWARFCAEYTTPLRNLTFAHPSPRFWAQLPTDAELYDVRNRNKDFPLRNSDDNKRFPFAGGLTGAYYFPLNMSVFPNRYMQAVPRNGSRLQRDGLSAFDAGLFLDSALKDQSTSRLMSQADYTRYAAAAPRALQGIHAALGIEEATLIAAPDAVHRKWFEATSEQEQSSSLSQPQDLPGSESSPFSRCRTADFEIAPVLNTISAATRNTVTLTWSLPQPTRSAEYILQRARQNDFSGAAEVNMGSATRFDVHNQASGVPYYYRVRAVVGEKQSLWSNEIGISFSVEKKWELEATARYHSEALTAVQRALLRMCAARGDMFAVLSMPEHFGVHQAVDYEKELRSPFALTAQSPTGSAEANDFSFGALYHPWIVVMSDERTKALRMLPPEGASCGVLARRANQRGAWIAPANEAFTEVVAIAPFLPRQRDELLEESQINVIHQRAQDFILLSAETLSASDDLKPINVRRLLSLLRRLALQQGDKYVFEPNDDAFQRLVHRQFEELLDRMYARGAFKGNVPDEAFQVVTDRSVNTPVSIEQGRFIVELRVAPSLPLTFLTIRLIKNGQQSTIVEGQ